MSRKPFLKWAGGKRWLADRSDFAIPEYSGRYIEPFLGGGAIFFSHLPKCSVLSDANARLIETYAAIRDHCEDVVELLRSHHDLHCAEYYYYLRAQTIDTVIGRAAQFVYLNRACWNGLYRVNRKGEFNVPIGSKDWILSDDDDFLAISAALANSELVAADFESSIDRAQSGDLIFADPPYTVAHNFNGFVKYNEKIFSWNDQVRLSKALARAVSRGAAVVSTNADHPSVVDLYSSFAHLSHLARASVISGSRQGRRLTTELLIVAGA